MKCILIPVFILCFIANVCSHPKDEKLNSLLSLKTSDQKGQDNQTILESSEVTKTPIETANETVRHRRFIPFARPNLKSANISQCTSSSDDFPPFLSNYAKINGGFVLFFLIGIYCFILLAVVCDRYFLPTVESICEKLNLSKDVAAATFMSTATSCPELFTNVISTFVVESDLGIGTIVGSSLFNTLGVAALGGLAASAPIQIDCWPLTRDVIIYILSVSLLVSITWDNRIQWYEGLTLFGLYFIYCIVLFNNDRIKNKLQRANKEKENSLENAGVYRNKSIETKSSKDEPIKISVVSADFQDSVKKNGDIAENHKNPYADKEDEDDLFIWPSGTLISKIVFYFLWPIKFVLHFTIPDPVRYPKLLPVTFAMCIIWIGANSYIVSWMMTLIGNIFKIPDAVLGLTFLAAGGCLPESISIVIMSRRGEGSMGVSNSMGANTMNILLSLGFPWFFKTILKGNGSEGFVEIESGSIQYTILALVAVAITLYLTLYFNNFHMSRKSGTVLIILYAVCVVLAILSEMVFFPKLKNCR
ncbi:unnamed protein product [Brassicogethes aeneus]|uniref:Sodium/calcium exchanger membrane region domain-containing protein n=1 Tax=Brassicogethes aeneus TaxID=1431903 RepID=A0A9P0B8K1_BRAAE|nr:unnamed protein product [Brassicogethes aeneus]